MGLVQQTSFGILDSFFLLFYFFAAGNSKQLLKFSGVFEYWD